MSAPEFRTPRPRSAFVPPNSLALRLYERAFSAPRDPRSGAYKAGVLAALRFREIHAPMRCPWPIGSAEADAWYSGTEEGHRCWREHTEQGRA